MEEKQHPHPFEVLYEKYDAWYDAEPGRSLFAIEALALEKSFLFQPVKALEIGVGTGRFAGTLRIRYGLDPALHPLRLARRRGVLCVGGDGGCLPFRSETFDACLLIVTLCFVQEPIGVLREAFRVLQPGGQVVLGMVLKESPWGKAYRKLAEEGHPFYSIATFYTYDEVVHGLRAAGFSSIQVFSTLLQPPGKPVYSPETPKEGYTANAGFSVFRALKGVE